ncbi:hypothetical protein RQP53_11250 [Paucibacter sp. APW11]|uniref:SH3b domain-containing protein n=1 Tax=Roseateles aquae TaxID=3077235 RepID=A0ABU3PBD5_9BURK|nr:hypothetical protein [Paucibacter sp. APW11]MDT8999845.1 hypothetical protein [Paucibacter sp. APW11]
MSLLAVPLALAIVAQDQLALRAAPRESSAVLVQLAQGESLELRGLRQDHVEVWDYRRERGGYVLAAGLRPVSLQAEAAPELLAVLRFLREQPGAEALGLAYAAAYLKAVPAAALTAEPFDALGQIADRLAQRASRTQGSGSTPAELQLAAQLEVAAGYGVQLQSLSQDGVMRVCYDGEAFRRVLAMPSATAAQRARAALGLSRPDCLADTLRPHERLAQLQARAELLDQLDLQPVSETQRNRVRLRRAGLWAELAQQFQIRGDLQASAPEAARRALQALTALNKAELADADRADYSEAALRVAASRWAAESAAGASNSRLQLTELPADPAKPGQHCLALTDSSARVPGAALLSACSYGAIWVNSAQFSPDGRAVALAVQPLAGWRELWLMQQTAAGWHLDVLPPSSEGPGLGYAEFAGWVPGGERLLLVRESRSGSRFKRSFETIKRADLSVEKQAASPDLLPVFQRWADPAWRRQTLSLR